MPRRLPILGWIGFDLGYSRAVAFARTKPPEEEEELPEPPLLRGILTGYDAPSCYYYAPAEPYPYFDFYTFIDGGTGIGRADGDYGTAETGTNAWEMYPGFDDLGEVGRAYSDAGCTADEGGIVGGWHSTFVITYDSGTGFFTVTGYHATAVVFSGTGPIDTAISNTVSAGALTLYYA